MSDKIDTETKLPLSKNKDDEVKMIIICTRE